MQSTIAFRVKRKRACAETATATLSVSSKKSTSPAKKKPVRKAVRSAEKVVSNDAAVEHAPIQPKVDLTEPTSNVNVASPYSVPIIDASVISSPPPTSIKEALLTAAAHLKSCDPLLKELIDRVGPPPEKLRSQPSSSVFEALASAIIYQQLAGAAASAIMNRFIALFTNPDNAFPSPSQVKGESMERLRSVGLSGRKASYIQDLADKISDGALPMNMSDFLHLTDAEVSDKVIRVKGIGQWTADMFLLFDLRRPDVLPVGDLGVRKGVKQLYGLKDLPAPDHMVALTKHWRPYRSLGAWYMWRQLEVVTL